MSVWKVQAQPLRRPGSQQCSLISVFSFPVQSPSSTTPPIEICSSRLTKLMRRTTDKKSEFLKALKDDRNGEITENRECDKLDDVRSLSLLCIWSLLLKELGLKKPWTMYVIQALEEEGNDSYWPGTCASGNSAQQWWREMCGTMKCKGISNKWGGRVTDVEGNLDFLQGFSEERKSTIF